VNGEVKSIDIEDSVLGDQTKGIQTADLGDSSVNSVKIKNGAIKIQDLGPNDTDSSKVVDNSLTGADIDESTLTGFLSAYRFGNSGSTGSGGGSAADPPCWLGEVEMFASDNYPLPGTAWAHGQLLLISQNQALYSLIGTKYGGNGTTTFALPNLQGLEPEGVNYVICINGLYPGP
jgi:Phage Tail Collar Domain